MKVTFEYATRMESFTRGKVQMGRSKVRVSRSTKMDLYSMEFGRGIKDMDRVYSCTLTVLCAKGSGRTMN